MVAFEDQPLEKFFVTLVKRGRIGMTISEEENGAELYSQPLVFENQNFNLYFRIKT